MASADLLMVAVHPWDLHGAAAAGLLLSVTADKVIRLVPPLILTEAEAAQMVALLCPLIKTFLAETSA